MLPRSQWGLGLLLMAGVASVHADSYRWRDADGHTHFSDALPAQAAAGGYEVINKQGMVVRRVGPGSLPPSVAPVVPPSDPVPAVPVPSEETVLQQQLQRRGALLETRRLLAADLERQERALNEHRAYAEQLQKEGSAGSPTARSRVDALGAIVKDLKQRLLDVERQVSALDPASKTETVPESSDR